METKRVYFKAKIIKRKDYLDNPESYQNVICLQVEPRWWQSVYNYGKINQRELHDQMVSFENWKLDPSEDAIHFYFKVRDRLAEASGELSREYKDHLHKEAKKECGFYDREGHLRSLRGMNRHELWELTDLMLRWAEEAEAYLDDLRPMYFELKEVK